jgi:hypothetical protein
MRVVTLEEHFSFSAIINRIDEAVVAERSFVLGSTRPGANPLP